MKNIFLIIPVLFIFFSCTRNNTVIEGNMINSHRDYLWLEYLNINKQEVLDSVKIKKDGSFKFSLFLDHPGIYILRNNRNELINLILKEEDNIRIEADYSEMSKNYSVSGSQESEYVRQLVEKIQYTRVKLDELDNSYGSLSSVSAEQATDYINIRKEIIKEQREFSIHFIIEHLNSLASIYAIYQTMGPGQFVLGENRDIQYMKIVADSLSVKYPETPFVQSFVTDARTSESKYYNMKGIQEKMMTAGTGLPDIMLPNTAGDSIKLSSLQGKIVLLYFWSSFSQASRENNVGLLNIYDKYKNKGFEVYAVSLDNNQRQWLDAVRYDELNWINVSDLDESKYSASIYNVKSLPTTYLINKEGDIVTRDIYGNELQKWLDNLLK